MNNELLEIFRAMRLKASSPMAHDIGPLDLLCECIEFNALDWCGIKGGCDHCILGTREVFGYSNQIILTKRMIHHE